MSAASDPPSLTYQDKVVIAATMLADTIEELEDTARHALAAELKKLLHDGADRLDEGTQQFVSTIIAQAERLQ